jgi:hypothetical protein
MLYKIPLKNSELTALVDDKAYEFLSENEYLKSVNFLKNLRLHSSGYAFFQKSTSTSKGMYKTVTIYLHKLLAETFLPKPSAKKRLYVLLRNGERLDCRIENLEWATFSKVTRNTRKRESKAGFRGVHQEREKFRAVIYRDGKRFDLGLFDTAEEAAQAYNLRSEEFFGKTIGLNKV